MNPYSPGFPIILLSVILGIISSFITLDFIGKTVSSKGKDIKSMLFGSISLTCSIGAIHYLDIFASFNEQVSYNFWLISLSSVLGFFLSFSMLQTLSYFDFNKFSLYVSGLLISITINSMQYVSIFAIEKEELRFNPTTFFLAILLPFFLSYFSLSIQFNIKFGKVLHRKILAAFLLGLAIIAMHYFAFSSLVIEPAGGNTESYFSMNGASVTALSLAFFFIIWFGAYLERSREAGCAKRFESLFDYNSDMILSLDLNGRIISANTAAQEILGYSFEELLQMNIDDLIPPEKYTFEKQHKVANAKMGETLSFESINQKKNGEQVHLNVTYVPININDRVIGTYRIGRDISRLKRENASLNAMFQNSPTPQMRLDPSGIILDVNKAFENLIGYEINDLKGTHFEELISPEEKNAAIENFERILIDDTKTALRTYLHKDGYPINLQITGIPAMYDGEIIGTYVICKDFSDKSQITGQLLDNEDILCQLLNDLNEAIFIVEITKDNRLGQYIEVNEIACRTLGYSREELLSMSVGEVTSKDHINSVNRRSVSLINNGFALFRTQHQTKDGRLLPVEVTGRISMLKGKIVSVAFARYLTEEEINSPLEDVAPSDPGKNLRMLMAEMDVNVSELANLTGVSSVTISNLRTGKHSKPKPSTARSIANALGVQPNQIWPD